MHGIVFHFAVFKVILGSFCALANFMDSRSSNPMPPTVILFEP